MPINQTRTLDVRPIPTWERHGRIFSAFSDLRDHASLTIVTDHEPRPLRLQFEERHPNEFVWEQRNTGIGRWEVHLRRLPPAEETVVGQTFFRQCAILSSASEGTLRAFEQAASERTFDEGTSIVEQDAQWPYLGLVRAGTLSAIAGSSTGRDQNLFDFLPRDTFGDVETLDGGRTVARIVATSSVRVVLIPRGVVISAMIADSMFARHLAAVCAQRVRALAAHFSAHVAHPAIARVAAALLPYASADAGLSPSLEPLQRMTQNQLAIVAGTAKEVAARAIAELEAAGALQRSQGHISRIDRAKLQAFVPEQ
jgi:CRP/FNR family transcriptional regulator